jgi:hypothetical protein
MVAQSPFAAVLSPRVEKVVFCCAAENSAVDKAVFACSLDNPLFIRICFFCKSDKEDDVNAVTVCSVANFLTAFDTLSKLFGCSFIDFIALEKLPNLLSCLFCM